jgi:hypothetical protein
LSERPQTPAKSQHQPPDAILPSVVARVLEAVARGELPPGGPSELAALDLLDDLPGSYWQRWSPDAAARIRTRATSADCCCVDGGRPAGDQVDDHHRDRGSPRRPTVHGRCSRCWGRMLVEDDGEPAGWLGTRDGDIALEHRP